MRNYKAIRIITVFAALLLALPLFASNSAETFGFGTRGISMGNAMTATVDDWSSVWYNPAGLGKTVQNRYCCF